MPKDHHKLSGKIAHVFAHRFVVETPQGAVLADLTPHGADLVRLRVGDQVTLEGEMKPSELKVSRFTCNGKTVEIPHKDKHDHAHHAPADPDVALRSVRAAGFETLGAPRRKPKHFEVLGRRNGTYLELHVELDGHIRKTKSIEDPSKWTAEMASA